MSPEQTESLRKIFESMARDSFGFKRSRKGTYVNPPIARDWKFFLMGACAVTVQNNDKTPSATPGKN